MALIAVGFAYLYLQRSSAYNQEAGLYNNLNSNYSAFKTQTQGQISTLQSQLNNNKTQLSNVSGKFNAVEYNLTHPYTQILYSSQTINLPRYNTSNYTLNSASNIYYYNVTWGSFNYTFNVPYPGYLVFNGTGTVLNNPSPSTCAWQVLISNKLGLRNVSQTFTGNNNGFIYKYAYRYQGIDELFINLTNAPFAELCPVQGVTYKIPVAAGKNYLIIDNYNTSGITVTFNAKYVGFHTS